MPILTVSTIYDEAAHPEVTIGRKFHKGSITLSLCRTLGIILAALLSLNFYHTASVQAAPRAQSSNPGTSPQLYLLPRDAANNIVMVDSHIAVLSVVDDASGPLLNVNATYRLRNPSTNAISLPIMLFPGGDLSISGFQNLSLTQNQQPIVLQNADGGGFLGQLELGAGASATVILQYQVGLGSNDLATVRYAPSILNSWAGNISARIELEMPSTIPAESWIEVAPDDWRYSVVSNPSVLGVRWLYDYNIPEAPLRLRFITPRIWSQLRAAENAASSGAAVSAYIQLGELYRDLVRVAPNDAARQRFYAQAIAAYSGGLTSPAFALASPNERASLHIGLADLYRRRLVEAQPTEQGGYADLMVASIEQALAILPADDSRVGELRQWQIDGWQLQLADARTMRNWPAALAIVEELALLPADVIDPATIVEDRRYILIQQALELMEQGNRAAALAVAGDQISADALMPPTESAGLFDGWQMTLTVSPEAMQLIAIGSTQPDRHDEAYQSLRDVVTQWENNNNGAYTFLLEDNPAEVALHSNVRLQIDFAAVDNSSFLLVSMLPPRVDYALLRSTLTQLTPTIERETGLIWQQIAIRQPLNLSSVVNEWNGVAVRLEEQAADFDAQSESLNADETASAEAALTAQIQAINYRATATEWRQLARKSSLLVNFQIDDPFFTRFKGEPASRAWTITAAAPSQTFVFQTQVLSLSRVLVGVILAFVVLIAIAGVLWGLL